jgi:hypothetical protein
MRVFGYVILIVVVDELMAGYRMVNQEYCHNQAGADDTNASHRN